MVGPSHAVMGLASAVAVARLIGLQPDAFGVIAILFGSLAPDIDGGGSITKPSKLFRGLIPRGIGNVIDAIFTGITQTVQSIFGHRGFFHWPLLALIMIALGRAMNHWWLVWFGIGYLSHILADSLTKEGVPLWAPVDRRHVAFQLFATGSVMELLVVFVTLALTVYFGFPLLPEGLQDGFREIYNHFLLRQR